MSEKSSFALHRVDRVEKVPYVGDVWNLTVDGSPTFQTSIGLSHNTQKPVELIQELMLASTQPGDLVIDPFLGSGTTLAVAQATGRVCYGTELDARFVDVIRKRWAEQVHGLGCDWVKLTPSA